MIQETLGSDKKLSPWNLSVVLVATLTSTQLLVQLSALSRDRSIHCSMSNTSEQWCSFLCVFKKENVIYTCINLLDVFRLERKGWNSWQFLLTVTSSIWLKSCLSLFLWEMEKIMMWAYLYMRHGVWYLQNKYNFIIRHHWTVQGQYLD